MNDWLNEYERFSEAAHVLGAENEVSIKLKSSDRMARVIRELAKGTSLLQEAVAKEMIDSLICIVAGEFLDNLSDDAKEIL